MTNLSRWDQVKEGMSISEVKAIFGEDIWQSPGYGEDTWLVNNERDPNPNRGYIVTFGPNGTVHSKGTFSTGG